jgi:hypothetical protein
MREFLRRLDEDAFRPRQGGAATRLRALAIVGAAIGFGIVIVGAISNGTSGRDLVLGGALGAGIGVLMVLIGSAFRRKGR